MNKTNIDLDIPHDVAERQRRRARGATLGPFMVERHDNDNGSIAYEIWTTDMKHRLVRMCDDDNKNAKADSELICKLLNNQHPE